MILNRFSTSVFPAATGCALHKSSGLFAEPLATVEMTTSDLALQAISKIAIISERQEDNHRNCLNFRNDIHV